MTVQAPPVHSTTTSPVAQFRFAGRVAGVVAIAGAINQVATPGAPAGAVYETAADYLRELSFLTYLVASIVAVLAAEHVGLTTRVGPRMIAVGYGLITIGVAIGLVVREELDWFFAVGGPGLLLSTVGFVVFAVGIWRGSSLPRWLAVLAGVGGVLAIIMSEAGTGVLIGSFWLFAASRATRA